MKCGETVEGRREKKPLPGLFFLLAFGSRRNLTWQAISPVSRLASTRLSLKADRCFWLSSEALYPGHGGFRTQ